MKTPTEKVAAPTLYLRSDKSDLSIGSLFTSEATTPLLFNSCQDIGKLEKINSQTTEITFAGHSEGNIFRSGFNVSGNQPNELARKMAQLYKGVDKTKLQHFYLLSCEAGLGNPSFAEKFSREMHKLGFTSLSVHANRPPNIPDIPTMRVEANVSQQGMKQDNILISSWYYKSKADESADEQIKTAIEELRGTMNRAVERNPNDPRLNELGSTLQTQLDGLRQKQAELRHYTCRNAPYKQEMSLQQNTFKNGKSSDAIPPRVGMAIDYLIKKKDALGRSNEGADGFAKEIDKINSQVTSLNQNPTLVNPVLVDLKPALDSTSNEVDSYISEVKEQINLAVNVENERSRHANRNVLIKIVMNLLGSDPVKDAEDKLSKYKPKGLTEKNIKDALFLKECKQELEQIKDFAKQELHMAKDISKDKSTVGLILRLFIYSEEKVQAAQNRVDKVNQYVVPLIEDIDLHENKSLNQLIVQSSDLVKSFGSTLASGVSAVATAGASATGAIIARLSSAVKGGASGNTIINVANSKSTGPSTDSKNIEQEIKQEIASYLNKENKSPSKESLMKVLQGYIEGPHEKENWDKVQLALNTHNKTRLNIFKESSAKRLVERVEAAFPVSRNVTGIAPTKKAVGVYESQNTLSFK